MRVEDREDERQEKKDSGEPAGDLGQHVRRLRAENILGHTAAERRAEAFAFRPLHQDDKHHEQRDQDENSGQNMDCKLHLGRPISPTEAVCKREDWAGRAGRCADAKPLASASSTSCLFMRVPDRVELLEPHFP